MDAKNPFLQNSGCPNWLSETSKDGFSLFLTKSLDPQIFVRNVFLTFIWPPKNILWVDSFGQIGYHKSLPGLWIQGLLSVNLISAYIPVEWRLFFYLFFDISMVYFLNIICIVPIQMQVISIKERFPNCYWNNCFDLIMWLVSSISQHRPMCVIGQIFMYILFTEYINL